jgi:hypothetical protein
LRRIHNSLSELSPELLIGGFMNRTKFWPFGALIALGVVVIAAIVAAMLFKYDRSVKASALPNAARIERVDGQVGINQSTDNSANAQWIQATANMPVGVGDRLYTKENSKTEIAFSGRNVATVDANTSLDLLDLSQKRTQVALREGSALFDVGSIPSGGLFEVATPCGAVDLQQPGLYQIAINQDGNATATAFSGAAQLVGQYGSGQIQKGESLAVSCQGNSPAVISRVEPNQAGPYIDNYYRERYPKRYDGRYRSYYTYLDDPYYYDPARSDNSYNYVSDYVPGIDDLDDYGQWQNVSGYGYCWHPNEYAGWSPYQEGYWEMDNPYGLTWVSSEPWGYAPYHYGRWAYASNDWYWVPERVNTYPAYSPALVAFLPIGNSSVAWVALGPSDSYATRYYDSYWQPSYAYPSNVIVDRVVNINVPGAVNVVSVQDFGRPIDRTVITRGDPQMFSRVRPVLDPLTIIPLRQAALQTREARRRIDVPRDLDQRLAGAQVVATNTPVAPPFRRDLARSFNVESLPARVRNQKLQISDRRNAAAQQAAPQPNVAADQSRERQMAELARQAARGNESARQQMRQLQQQPAQPLAGVRARAQAQAQPQAERVGQAAQPQQQRELIRQQQQVQREAARQQMITSQQQRRAAQEQMRVQRQQTQPQRVTPRAMPNAPQPQVLRSPQQRRVQPQPQYQRPAQPRVIAPQSRPQAERRVAPPMRVTQPPPRPQVVQPQPQARPRQQAVQPRPQAQPKPQVVQPRPQAQPRPGKPPEQKGGEKKKPGGPE